MFQVGCQDLQNNFGSIGTLGKSHKPFETDKKMKKGKQAKYSYPSKLSLALLFEKRHPMKHALENHVGK